VNMPRKNEGHGGHHGHALLHTPGLAGLNWRKTTNKWILWGLAVHYKTKGTGRRLRGSQD
jgi:hypothetical protein